jgi:hypothetical protein
MSNAATADLIGRLEVTISDLERRLAKYERPAPPAAFPDGHATISHVTNPVVPPTAEELHRLEEIVLRQYPKLRS